MKLADWMPRRSLGWLSRAKVRKVLGQVVSLYLGPHESLTVAPPEHLFGNGPVRITYQAGGIRFDWTFYTERLPQGVPLVTWLKCPPNANPYFEAGSDPVRVDFRHPAADVPAYLVKAYSWHFPFAATNNFLVNGGKPIV